MRFYIKLPHSLPFGGGGGVTYMCRDGIVTFGH